MDWISAAKVAPKTLFGAMLSSKAGSTGGSESGTHRPCKALAKPYKAGLYPLRSEAERRAASYQEAAGEGEVCAAANDNAPAQVVISGARAAIERAVALAPKFGARRAVLLPVSAPFHCALMQPAARVMQKALSEVKISAPSVPLVANVLASAISDPEAIRARLIDQVTGMVRWRESMLYLRDQGVDSLYEIGAGRVLTGLARRFEGFEARSVGTPEELEAAATALQAHNA